MAVSKVRQEFARVFSPSPKT